MDTLVQLVGGYRERDGLLKLCQYAAGFLSSTGKNEMPNHLDKIAKQFSKCRRVLRLFDNMPLLAYTLPRGDRGTTENTSQVRVLKAEEKDCYLAVMEHCADLINAINWHQEGYLYSRME